MRRLLSLSRSLVGKKMLMAATGLILFLFVVGHLLGNLKVFQGADKFNAYAEGLRTVGAPFFRRGELLWAARLVLLVAVLVHAWAALEVARAHRLGNGGGVEPLALVGDVDPQLAGMALHPDHHRQRGVFPVAADDRVGQGLGHGHPKAEGGAPRRRGREEAVPGEELDGLLHLGHGAGHAKGDLDRGARRVGGGAADLQGERLGHG